MPHVQPLFLPKPVVAENALVLENDFRVEPRQFAFGPDGRLHVLSFLSYNYYRYDKGDNRTFSTHLINVYGPDLSPERIAYFSRRNRDADRDDYLTWDLFAPYLFVTPENLVALTTPENQTFLLDARLEGRVGEFGGTDTRDVQQLCDRGFAYHAEPTPEGRLLCLVSEPGMEMGDFGPNLLCLSDGSPLGPGQRPELLCIACLEPMLRVEATFPYVRLPDGARAGKDHRPTPSLVEQAKQRFGVDLYGYWIGQALPIDEGKCLVSLFHRLMRSGSKGLDFVFALVAHDGKVVGRVEGIDRYSESPFVEHHYRIAVDRAHGRIVYKNKTSFFLFDLEGKPLTQVKLEGEALRGLSVLKLGGCSPDGRIILHHPKQHLLLALDPVRDPADLGSALADALTFLKKERTRLKKRYEVVSHRWLHPGPVVRH